MTHPDQVWAQVRADLAAMHANLGVPDIFANLDKPTVDLLRIAAVVGYQLGADDTADEFEKAIP